MDGLSRLALAIVDADRTYLEREAVRILSLGALRALEAGEADDAYLQASAAQRLRDRLRAEKVMRP